MFQMKDQARQGDVFLLTVGELPKNVQQIAAEGGRTILQHGEATGHAHAIASPRVAMYAETGAGSGGRRFLVVEPGSSVEMPVFSDNILDEHGNPLMVGTKTVDAVPLGHEEHRTVLVPPGVHEIRIHREYVAPQIERQVAD